MRSKCTTTEIVFSTQGCYGLDVGFVFKDGCSSLLRIVEISRLEFNRIGMVICTDVYMATKQTARKGSTGNRVNRGCYIL